MTPTPFKRTSGIPMPPDNNRPKGYAEAIRELLENGTIGDSIHLPIPSRTARAYIAAATKRGGWFICRREDHGTRIWKKSS